VTNYFRIRYARISFAVETTLNRFDTKSTESEMAKALRHVELLLDNKMAQF
jgi:hypothetical protein